MMVSVTTREFKNWTVAEIKGRVDAFNDKRVIRSLEMLIQAGHRSLALDLSDVAFIGFQAMKEILKMAETVSQNRGEVVLVAPNAQVRRHLDSFAGHKGLKVFRSFDELQTGLFFVPRSEYASAPATSQF